MTATRPEHEFLLACVRWAAGRRDGPGPDTLLTGPLDWDYVVKTARYHQIIPLLHQALGSSPAVPEVHLGSIQQLYDDTVARTRRLTNELFRILDSARRARIAVIAFKGPVLAAEMYGTLGLRQFADLDLLIDPAESSRAEELLTMLGYRRRGTDWGYEVDFVNDERDVRVDLHRGLTPPGFPLPMAFARWWDRRATVSIEGHAVETLSVEDLLVVLCIQVARDAWQGKTRLAKICDLGRVFRCEPGVNWAKVGREAARLRVRRVVDFGVNLALRVLRMPLPPAAMPSRHHRMVSFLVRQEEQALFDDRDNPPASRIRGAFMHFHLRERWRDKLRPYWQTRLVVPNRRDRDFVALPPALAWFYWVVRAVRLVHDHGRYLMGIRRE